MKWLDKYQDDAVIKEIFDRLNNIGKSVFNYEKQSIEHFKCKNMPAGLNEDTYVLVFRKTNQIMRYEIFQIVSKFGGPTSDQERAQEIMKEIDQVFINKPDY